MAKIIKVGSNNPTFTSHNVANLAKTARNGNHTNPFKFSNFEGNTLQFADVFEGFEPKKTSKMRMIASSVTGSMNKIKSSIAEPIVNFVNRVRSGISSAWDYAKNTDILEVSAIKSFNEVMNKPIEIPGLKDISSSMVSGIGKGISSGVDFLNRDITDIGKGISSKMDFLNKDVTDIGKDLADKWTGLVSRIHKDDLSTMSVSELEQRWISHNLAMESEVA